MKQNLPNDELEKFLKGAFEDYTESPPDGVWDKIAGDLSSTSAVVTTGKTILMKKWWVAAAAAVFGGVVLCQHLYFQNKLNTVSEALENKEIEYQEVVAELEEIKQIEESNPGTPFQTENLAGDIGKSVLEEENSIQKSKLYEENSTLSTNEINPENENIETPGLNEKPDEVLTQNPIKPFNQANKHSQDIDIPEPTFYLKRMPELRVENAVSMTPKPIIFKLEGISESAIEPIKRGNWYAGVNSLFSKSREKILGIDDLPGPGPPPLPGKQRKCFNDDLQSKGQQHLTGITVGYQSTKSWGFQTGIMVKRTSFSSDHKAKFRFEDRDHEFDHNHPDYEHNFEYSLNTSFGLVDMDLRVEQKNHNDNIKQNEKLDFNLETEQVIEYWTVPVLLTYRVGRGKIGLKLKAGLFANILKSKEFNFTDIEVENNKFKLHPVLRPVGHQRGLKSLSFDYLASLGVDVFISRNFNLAIEPTLIGAIADRHNISAIRSRSFSGGVNAGITYHF